MLRIVWLVLMSLLGATAVASAETVTFRFRGDIVTNLPEPYSILNGGRLEIVYTIESTTPDSNPEDAESGVYYNPYVGGYIKVQNGRHRFQWKIDLARQSAIEVHNTSTADSYFAGAYLVPQGETFDPDYFVVQLVDVTRQAFLSDALPVDVDLSQFEWLRNVQLTFIGGNCCATFGLTTDIRVWPR